MNGIPEHFDIRQVADSLGVHKRVCERRAIKEGWAYTETSGRGGKRRIYALIDLPEKVQGAVLIQHAPKAEPATRVHTKKRQLSPERIASIWQRYERVKQPLKDTAAQRLKAIHAVEALVNNGMPMMEARALVAEQLERDGASAANTASIARWQKLCEGAHRSDWLALLVPQFSGRTTTAEIHPAAWAIFKADWLRLEQPSAESCYRRLQRVAKVNPDWPELPCIRTFKRKIEREIPRGARILAREGNEALMKTFPAQERDRSVFAALDGVNADGHMFDVGVRFPDGSTGRPILVGFQDLGFGKILSWRIGQSESSDLVRLAFCDLVEQFGIPRKCWLDNGRAFASKFLTGGTPNRYRFKVREEDPVGIITGLGVEVHWATPYHGQAKPIERAWRDFCDTIAKHPAFAGAYLGNCVANKPENYGSRVIEWDAFERVVTEEIHAHNAREGRRAKVCAGRSFDQVFNASYQTTEIRKASPEQLRTLLLAAEAVSASRVDGSVHVAGNRYWCDALSAHAGRKVVLRFDPMALHAGVHCYALDNSYIGYADCIASVGFADTNAAREHAQARKHYRKATRQVLDAERRMDAASVAAQLPPIFADETPAASVIAPIFGGPKKPTTKPAPEPLARTGTDDADTGLSDFLKRIQEQQNRDRL
jgi:putative transposase